MRNLVRYCALAIGIWLSLATPSGRLQFVAWAGPLNMGDAMMTHLLMPWLWIARLATIWVLLRLGWSALSSRTRVRKLQPHPLSNLSNAGYPGRKLWTR